MSFNDDEPIVATEDDSGEESDFLSSERIKVEIISQLEAPLEESRFKVLLTLTGRASDNGRSGVDLVMVLDVSGSMADGDKLIKTKHAVQFILKKLSPIDRLSVVIYSRAAKRLCPLRNITETSLADIEMQVFALRAGGSTNIADGLTLGLKVLNDRNFKSGRVTAIMLVSDGDQTSGDATQVLIGNVPVFTFGLGLDFNPIVLNAIANNSMGGTFADVRNINDLSIAFALCLAGLLNVVAQDLKLTIKQVNGASRIEKASAGKFPQSTDDAVGSVTISFGDLYDKEQRRLMVDLCLPFVSVPALSEDILHIYHTFSIREKLFCANPLTVAVARLRISTKQEKVEVMIEENRLQTIEMIKEAMSMADRKNLEDAKDKIVEAQCLIEDVVPEFNHSIEMLKFEMRQLLTMMRSQERYDREARSFALSFSSAHDHQRFATPLTDKYLQQAKAFDEDPTKPIPTM